MSGYIGILPVPQATETRNSFTATSNQTSFATDGYTPNFVSVYLNGVLLSAADFTATNGTNVVLASGAAADDVVEVIAFSTFQSADALPLTGGTMTGALAMSGANITLGTSGSGSDDRIALGASAHGQIYHDGTNFLIQETGSGNLLIDGTNISFRSAAAENYISCVADGAVSLYYDNAIKIATSASGIDVTGKATLTSGELTFSGSISDPNGAAYIWRPADNTLAFGTANEERMRIDSSGNVMVGGTNTNPIGNHVSEAIINGANGTGIHRDGGTPFKLGTDGNRAIAIFHINGADVGSIDVSGSSTSYTTSSDYRLKTDAQPMTNATARVLALKPVNFEWISDGTRVDGFLAHEAQAVVPEAVTGTKDAMMDEEYEVTPAVLDDDGNETKSAVMGTRSVPDMQGIDQSKLVPLLVAALQDALARITALENA